MAPESGAREAVFCLGGGGKLCSTKQEEIPTFSWEATIFRLEIC